MTNLLLILILGVLVFRAWQERRGYHSKHQRAAMRILIEDTEAIRKAING